jgi:hypothetical protein
MKKSRFSDSQILSILKQAEGGAPVPERKRSFHDVVDLLHVMQRPQ